MSTAPQPSFVPAFDQEIRFALVMYGGVSLAIYINGVTQEFLNLVKATATNADGDLLDDGALTGTAAVYRKLASILRPSGTSDPEQRLHTRFVVDIASGSSAGGINAIFLGKALANNSTLDNLSKLWQEQAGMEDLLNDSRGGDGNRFAQDPPQSLLSCPGIYNKLLDAFIGMDDPKKPPVPLQREMDVFITATDLQGLELPIELADMQVFEKRYKNVFQLRFATDEQGAYEENHFTPERNAFLAFAARATSSFPVAFEPMTLEAIDDIASQKSTAKPVFKSDNEKLREFFPDYVSASADGGYKKRAFGDGGDLDNKPFSHAIAALSRRTAELPVHRKLVYIEPSPDAPQGNAVAPPPNFIENTLAATMTLHLAETIREDLQRVLERNRLIERVKEVTDNVAQDVALWKSSRPPFSGYLEKGYEDRTIDKEIRDRGPGYAGYHRLKVRSVTDDLTGLIIRAAELLEESDEFRAIRFIIGEWRKKTYQEKDAAFLLAFDLSYRDRRLRFLLTKLDEWMVSDKIDQAHQAEIKQLKKSLNTVAKIFSNLRRETRRRGPDNFAYEKVQALHIDAALLHTLLNLPESEREAWIDKYLETATVTELATSVGAHYKTATMKASDMTKACLNPDGKDVTTASGRKLRVDLRQYFDDYEYYDQIIFPIFYETSVGEAEPADVIRISPQDAKSIIDETRMGERRRKLAGTALGHFAAFLDPLWRSNDILWGRLDGAERIITSLLPRSSPFAEQLIEEAHLAIIREHFRPNAQAEVKNLIVKAILSMPRESRDPSRTLKDILESHVRVPVDKTVDAVFTECLSDKEIYAYLKTNYEVNREFNPANTLDVLGRSTQVIGKMLQDVAKTSKSEQVRNAVTKRAAWIARLGSMFWSFVQLATPGGIGHQFFHHWLKILYVFEALLLVGSTLAASGSTQQFAVTALTVTAVSHLFVAVLGDVMRTRHWLYRPLLLVGFLVVALAGIGFWTVHHETIPWVLAWINRHLPWLA